MFEDEIIRTNFVNDPELAEDFLRLVTELPLCRLDEVFPGPALPFECNDDPEAMIVLMRGYDVGSDKPVEMVLIEKNEKLSILTSLYVACIWGRFNPITDEDFQNLPDLYEVGFYTEGDDQEHPLLRMRWEMVPVKGDNMARLEMDTGNYVNLINTNVDSDVMKLLNTMGI